ncbi:transposase [Chitinophaga sp. YR627]|uniref:transposase n=1 Tax=Chitinophaga sp. YR627 TaxID=1881041 RepID=UPI0039775D21
MKQTKIKPNNVTADAGYGSEQNYEWLASKKITADVKHQNFDRDQHKRTRNKNPYRVDKLAYNEAKDHYICPSGKRMKSIGSYRSTTSTGFEQILTCYQASKCKCCPLKEQCHQGKGNRVITTNHHLNYLRNKVDKRLKTSRGIAKRKQRCYDVEPVFGNIKHNHHFKRLCYEALKK